MLIVPARSATFLKERCMLDHITIHVSDSERSRAFYLSALAALGYVARKTFETDGAFILDPDGYNIEAVCHRVA